MRFKNYLAGLNELAKNRPDVLEYSVISASDDEGNSYSPVKYLPSLFHYDEGSREIYTLDDGLEINAICIN